MLLYGCRGQFPLFTVPAATAAVYATQHTHTQQTIKKKRQKYPNCRLIEFHKYDWDVRIATKTKCIYEVIFHCVCANRGKKPWMFGNKSSHSQHHMFPRIASINSGCCCAVKILWHILFNQCSFSCPACRYMPLHRPVLLMLCMCVFGCLFICLIVCCCYVVVADMDHAIYTHNQ